jgi:C-methyltransferase
MTETLSELLRGATATRVTGLVAELGVADALTAGPRRVADVAHEVGADPETLDRYLLALSTGGVFEQVEPGVYRNTEASELLRVGEPWNAFARLYGGVWYRAVGDLDATGAKAFDGDFWSWLASHPEERQLFDLAMEDGKEERAERLAALDWRDGETVVDVGGGNGSLLLELFARRPGLRGVVLDLPETVRDERALAAAGIRFVGGSFFDGVPEGDAYVLGTVLHNWPDAEAARILRTIRDHAPADARVLILEWVVQPGSEPAWFALLGHALFGSHERTEAGWRTLLGEAGLRVEAVTDRLLQATCP